MKIGFEDGTTFITVRSDFDTVVHIRCNTSYTDIRDDESLDSFTKRHGGVDGCRRALVKFYREATNQHG